MLYGDGGLRRRVVVVGEPSPEEDLLGELCPEDEEDSPKMQKWYLSQMEAARVLERNFFLNLGSIYRTR